MKNRRILKAVNTKLPIGRNQMYALRHKEGIVTMYMAKVVKVAHEFYRDLYITRESQDDSGRERGPEEFFISPILIEELKDALERKG